MTFREVAAQVIDWLQQDKRVSYRALKREFDIDDDYIEDLKEELLYAHESMVQADERGFTWTDKTAVTPVMTSQPDQPEPQPVVEPAEPVQNTSSVEPHTPDAERRQLTVMFVDLVGSTSLSGALDPEDLRDLVTAYQAACTDIIQRFEGYVAQHLGDGILCYFGYPTAHEDDAQRAVRTGLGIIEEMQILNERLEQTHGMQLTVRIAVHTGLVVVGNIGAGARQEQLALGETPNVAARMQELAEPDTVVISADTYRLIQGYFDCAALGEHALRGVSQAIAVYRVLGDRGIQSRLDAVGTRGFTPLVGRHAELQLLLDRWKQATLGEGHIVLLHAEPGLGKSRMVQTLREHLVDESYTHLECRSSPYYHNTALYPVVDLIQRMLRWGPNDTTDEKLGKLEQTLSQSRLPRDETVPLIAVLLSLPLPEDRYPPLNLTPQRQRQKTLETIVAMLLELAQREPVLFILEDLHWADPSTLELLDLLVDQTPTASIYTLLTCRPEFQPPWSNRSYFTQVTLSRLSRDGVKQMVTKVAAEKTLPDEVIQHLVDKTDGVPLYIEEMTKAVLESGVLTERDAQYALTGPISSLSIPATLQESLMARLDRLVTAKGIAQMGATIGRQFSYALLHAVLEVDEETLHKELHRLIAAELVYQWGVPPQSTYLFKHALIQDTAYESLLRRTRQQYHQRIAQALEAKFPETTATQPEVVAHHYTEAGCMEQAIGYWQRAGDQASNRSAYQEAISHVTTGLDLLQLLPETLARHQQELPLQTALGAASLFIKGHVAPEVETAYTRAHLLCQLLGDTQDVSLVLFGLWRFYMVRADFPRSRQLGEEVLRLAEERDETPLYVVAHYMLGFTGLCVGEFHAALSYFEAVRARYTPSQRSSPLYWAGQDPGVACRTFGAFALWSRGYPDQALARAQEGLVLATELDHAFTYTFALLTLSMLYQFRREGQPVYDSSAKALALSTEQGFPYWLPMSVFMQGWAFMSLGKREAGLQHMRQGLTDWRAPGGDLYIPYALALLAEGSANLKQVEAGCDIVNEGLEIIARTGEHWCEAELHRIKGELLLQQSADNTTEAASCFRQAIAIAQHQHAKSWELRAVTSLARLWQSQGKRDDARELLEPVYSWFTEGFDTADLIDAKALLDELPEGSS